MRRFVVVLLVFVLMGAPQLAHAHDPFVEDPNAEWGDLTAPWQAPDALTSYALYGRLGVFGDVDAFAYTFGEPTQNWPLDILIPVCGQHFEPFYPSIALIGPGLDAPTAALPFELPPGMGVQVLAEAQKPEPRPSYLNIHAGLIYNYTEHRVNIPQAGQYLVAVWEPDGHVGAYILATGQLERFSADRADARRKALELIRSGQWMGQDCSASLATEQCPATPPDALGPFYKPDAPVRASVGKGYVLTGDVRDSTTCLPIPGAKIEFWQVNEQAEYTDDKRATVFANRQGAYRFESNRPLPYAGRPPHIHLRISAPGYRTLVTQHYPTGEANTARFAIALIPAR